MKAIPYDDIDIEMRELIRQLNMVPGLRTTSCCFGHGEEQSLVCLRFKTIRHMNNFLWGGCWRWFALNTRGAQWWLELDNGDTPRNSNIIRCYLGTRDIGTVEMVDKLVDGLGKFNAANDHSNRVKWFWRDLTAPVVYPFKRFIKRIKRWNIKPEVCPVEAVA